jgi:NAD(P)H dehydrogenase (quinone)
MTVAITGAAGQLGSLVAAQLLETLGPEEVILVTRRPEELQRFADRGVRVRRADLDEPETLAPAFEGADRLLLISTTHQSTPRRVQQHSDAVEAAKSVGVTHVAFTSMPKVDQNHPTGPYAIEYLDSENMLKESGVAWTILQNAPYSSYLIPRLQLALATGRMPTNAGDGETAPVSHDDCAAVAVAVLTEDGYENTTLVCTGPELFTQAKLAALVSEVAGTELPVLELSDEEMPGTVLADGFPDPMHVFFTRHLKAVRLGYFNDLTPVIKDVTGREPHTVRATLEEHADELRAAIPADEGSAPQMSGGGDSWQKN